MPYRPFLHPDGACRSLGPRPWGIQVGEGGGLDDLVEHVHILHRDVTGTLPGRQRVTGDSRVPDSCGYGSLDPAVFGRQRPDIVHRACVAAYDVVPDHFLSRPCQALGLHLICELLLYDLPVGPA